MKGKLIKLSAVFLTTVSLTLNVFSGGMPEDDDDLARELARTQNELDSQKGKADDLQNQINNLNSKLNDLESREPKVVEKVIERQNVSSGFDWDTFPIHGYASTSYADSDLRNESGTFHQEMIDIELEFTLSEDFIFYADIGFLDGTEISIDGNEFGGVGDVSAWEVWLDWRALENNLVLRFGKFKSPFSKWTMDEIPWSTVSVFNPLILNMDFVPYATTGIQEYGEYELGDVKLFQTLYFGNGKGSSPHSKDSNTDKVLGARLAAGIPFIKSENTLTFGISGYLGRDDSNNDFQQKTWGYDVKLDIGQITLRAEAVKSRISEDNGHVWSNGWFGQVSYRFIEKWEAYYRHDCGDTDTRFVNDGDLRINSIGLSFRPIEKVVFKTGYGWYESDDISKDKYEVFASQVALIF